jgi:hypothetical protein
MEQSGFPETNEQLFREWNKVDFPKPMNSCFGNGTKWISRNQYLAIVSGNPFHSIPETTGNYF